MSDHTRFEIEIYCEGVVGEVHLRGKRRYLMETAFLDELSGHPVDRAPRPVPDRHACLYMLSREQFRAYAKFHRKLDRIEREMPVRKAEDRMRHGAENLTSREFESFCMSPALGLAYVDLTPESAVRYAINTLTREEREGALRFLDCIAAGNHDAAALEQVWDRCTSDAGLSRETDVRTFFLAVRAEMAKLVKPVIKRRHARH